ncbi:hypothetical protein GOC60_05175 [Sinorhizobium meliloti]|nr:hypothetical protein [Sinorhizobium meliloti]MDX0260597.1 hypothetical protein [Sinorhizobium meliloti]MDX0347708.1 hypothetical protein [Sinorhizobium meliloti]
MNKALPMPSRGIQLSLNLQMIETANKPKATDLDWEVEAALSWHDEDSRATIATLLLDCKHLREQLA